MPDDVVIAICGAGPVGAAFALFLRERGIAAERIALIDARTREAAAADDRMIAISSGSATLLARLGAWNDGAALRATAIEAIHVSHRGRFGQTVIDRRDHAVAALGYVVRHGDLTQALDDALARQGVTVHRPQRVAGIEVEDGGLRLSTSSDDGPQDSLFVRHVVHAEGGLFDRQQRREIHRDYLQTAVTGFVTTDHEAASLAHTAFERFTNDGPIALLPASQAQSDGRSRNGYSLVWCGRPDDATARLAMSDDAFLASLHAAFGDRLGRFATVGPRRSYPLGLNAVAEPARLRSPTAAEFAIGNAAQTLHPVAGQGLNLGLRDAHDLARSLVEADRGAVDAAALIARYRALRRVDRAATVNLTDLMPRLFASPATPVAWGRGVTLALLDVATPLRGLFARQMMNGRR
ncbi:MAG: FAD-dependent monooxygenase [Burkholderiaceae bacterium]